MRPRVPEIDTGKLSAPRPDALQRDQDLLEDDLRLELPLGRATAERIEQVANSRPLHRPPEGPQQRHPTAKTDQRIIGGNLEAGGHLALVELLEGSGVSPPGMRRIARKQSRVEHAKARNSEA